MKARLPADTGELIVKALEMAMDDQFNVGARLARDRAERRVARKAGSYIASSASGRKKLARQIRL